MNEVNSTAQIPTNAFADAVLLLSLGEEFVVHYSAEMFPSQLGKALLVGNVLSRKVQGDWRTP